MPVVLRSNLKRRPAAVRILTWAATFLTIVYAALPRMELAILLAFMIVAVMFRVMIGQ